MYPIVVVLCFVAATQAALVLPDHAKQYVDKATQYDLYKQYSSSITLNNDDRTHAFKGLDHDGTKKVDEKDLRWFYWHEDLTFAIQKFIKLYNDNGDQVIEEKELENDFKKKEIRVALIECHYLKSPGLKQSCFADQLATYASLVLEDAQVTEFFKKVSGNDGKWSQEEVLSHKAKFNTRDLEITIEELGGKTADKVITHEEFKDYVIQESIGDDFRRCTNKDRKLDYDCLLEELVEYTNDDLTEMDISVLFRAFDKTNDGKITKDEFKQILEITDDAAATQLMKTLDMSLTTSKGDAPVIDYGEFRTYMKSPTVLIQAERDCTEDKNTQIEELNCLFDLFKRLATESHRSIWLVVPDLEQQIAFETLDTDNNGQIKTSELLNHYDVEAKTMFVIEFDTDDEGEEVDLEEFNEYMDMPHMVYGTGDCLLQIKQKGKRDICYEQEIFSMIDNIKHTNDKNFWKNWFDQYNTDKKDEVINVDDANEAENKFGSQADEDLFLLEIGQGDKTIRLFEFTWYVKQQEISKQYKGIPFDFKKYHDILNDWIKNRVTEYDVEQFFDELDKEDADGVQDHELTKDDFKSNWETVQTLIKRIDGFGDDADTTVNFREFWLWLQTGDVKKVLERECTQKQTTQQGEIDCYVNLFNQNPEKLK